MSRRSDRDALTGRKRSSKKKIVLIVILVLAAIAAAGFFVWKKFFRKPPVEDFVPQPQIESAVRTDVEKLYNATGKIISGGEAAVSSAAYGDTKYMVDEVYVRVGDTVREGDILYTLDMSSLEEDIEIQKKKLALQQQADAIDQSASQRALAEAQAQSGEQYTEATRELIRKAQSIDKSIIEQIRSYDDVQVYIDKENRAKEIYDRMRGDYEWLSNQDRDYKKQISDQTAAMNLLAEQRQHLVARYTEGSVVDTDVYDTDEYISLSSRIADMDYQIAQLQYQEDLISNELTEIHSAESSYLEAKSDRQAAETALELIQSGVYSLEDLGSATIKGNRSVLEAEQSARDSIARQGISRQLTEIDTEKEIRRNLEMLESGIVRANMDGTVTSVKVTPGKSFSGADAVVLNNLENMKVIVDIDEAHIADLAVGMPVRIRTDSTGEVQLEGEVIFTAQIPNEEVVATSTQNANTSSRAATQSAAASKPMYRVEISLHDVNERLRVGMTAKIEFVLASSKDCIAVPTSCITTDPEGNSFVRVITEDGQDGMAGEFPDKYASGSDGMDDMGDMDGDDPGLTGETLGNSVREVLVTTGVKDDYYTEITSGNIQEGDMLEGEMSYGGFGSFDMLDGIY